MKPGGTGETPEQGREQPGGIFLTILRSAALTALLVGAVGSISLLLFAGRNTPRLLLVLFVIWILSPFVALGWANVVAKRWSLLTRATLYCVTLVIALGSLAAYAGGVSPPKGSSRAFMFVIVSPASWLLLSVAVPMAALISRWRSRRGASGVAQ
jgi:hypothetical protein